MQDTCDCADDNETKGQVARVTAAQDIREHERSMLARIGWGALGTVAALGAVAFAIVPLDGPAGKVAARADSDAAFVRTFADAGRTTTRRRAAPALASQRRQSIYAGFFETSDPELTPPEVMEAIAPIVQIGRKEYVAGRICFALMFFLPPDGTFSAPPRMIETLARVYRDFPPELFESWDADAPYQSGIMTRQPPPDPDKALAAFMGGKMTHVTGAFAGRRWNGTLDGMVPTIQLVSWFYDRTLGQDSNKDVGRSNTFQVNIPLSVLDNLKRPQFTQQLFAELCNILQPLFAVGGLCMATPLDAAILQAQ